MRIGFGFDVHEVAPDRPLVLGGVQIPAEFGLLGHSDADVVLHAVMDAMLGALALGDIGQHFPNTDSRYKDADSYALLQRVWTLVTSQGYKLGNLDVMVLAEAPKLTPHVGKMRERIASACEANTGQISVKATTMETLGFVGRREGIAAQAVVLLVSNVV
ncbi:2-C-methyl-D-erythritol 2,4-cyclodiphosphate synthase [Alicyclobacillus dauci]|uniref:2-C-methyl-D-erythritol 2,4-cyclodiphosphate synthase n=1 Tax=Alicyclobacillus dauci TaxID=1475485 RepID=A0ABY6Z4X0_9BACL|nr:2-C-methyl-D-erythritol 2,4-cyclodiphosphate synthase [Alicyclobacillus dauci]WAH37371.1 2-C-methyl-D-erythritol 2,4-cyclodiphosphate synthase [Alicyclobacillus dauci]